MVVGKRREKSKLNKNETEYNSKRIREKKIIEREKSIKENETEMKKKEKQIERKVGIVERT